MTLDLCKTISTLFPKPLAALLCTIILLLAPSATLLAQDSRQQEAYQPVQAREMEGKTIKEVRVKGNRRVETASILNRVRSAPGSPLQRSKLSEDIERIWALSYFEDIKVDAAPADGGVVLTFMVTEKPAIAEVTYQGNDEVSQEDIEEVVDIKRFQILDVGRIKVNAEKIRKLYLDKGFYLAEVDHKLEQDETLPDQVRVVFVVREYAKVEVKKITILGNKAIDDETLKSIMQTREGSWFSFLTGFGTFKEDAFETDTRILTAYYYDKGYVQVRVTRPTLRLSKDKRFLYITLGVEEGPAFDVGEVDVQGEFIKKKAKLMELVKLKQGDRFSSGAMRQDLESLRDLYRDAGYAFVNVDQLPKINAQERTVDVTYDIQKGNKVYIGRIDIAGNAVTRDKVIRRELSIAEGQLYSEALIELSKRRVQRLGFFEKVDITTQRSKRDDTIDLVVTVSERPTGTFQAGAGFSSTESILANLQVSQNNLFGRGQSLALQIQWSSIRTLFDARFTEPYFLDSKVRLSVRGYNFNFAFPDYTQESVGGSLTLGYPLINDLLSAQDLSVSMTYKLEDVEITAGGRGARSSRQIGSLFRGGVTSSLSAGLFYDSRNNPFFPTTGSFQSARVEAADDVWTQSETEFLKYDLESRWYFPLFWQFVLRLNGRLGYITNIDPFKAVPLQERYLVGGPNSIRGFRRFSLGPRRTVAASGFDPATQGSDFRIGGDKQLLLTTEIEFPILQAINLNGVFFADAGNAFGEGQSYTLMPDLLLDNEDNYSDALRTALGFGARWFSPIGLLRFEWGFPLQRLRNEEPVVFEFSIGNAF